MQLTAKDQELLGKENDFKLQLKDLENENKLKIKDLENKYNLKLLELTKEKDATIQTLRNEIEMMKTKVRPQENVQTQPIKANELQKQEEVEPKKTFPVQIERVFTKAEILAWGPDTFFGGKVLEEKVFESYEDWYRRISLLLVNDKQENVFSGGNRYVLIKKQFEKCHKRIDLGFKENIRFDYEVEDNDIIVGNLRQEAIGEENLFLLHPASSGKHLNFSKYWNPEWRKIENVTEDYYFGEVKSAIVLVVSK